MSEINPQKSAYFVRNVVSKSSTSSNTSAAKSVTTSSSLENENNKSTNLNPTPTKPVTSVLNIPGTRTSLQNNQLLTPIGIPSIDSFIGGGLPVGSLCLIGQDKYNSYSDIITRCFIAEGVVHKHSVYVADLNEEAKNLLQRIPDANKSEKETDLVKTSNEELRIAWRYAQHQHPQQQQQQQTSSDDTTNLSKSFQSNYFVMNKFMNHEEIKSSTNFKSFELANMFDQLSVSNDANYYYSKLIQDISSHIDSVNMNVNKTKKYTNILRIIINSIGGLEWNDKSTLNEKNSIALCKFLFNLRMLLRHSLAVCVLTIPNEIVNNPDLLERYGHLSDYVFVLDDSSNSVSRLNKTQYDGLFRIEKLPRLNSLTQCFMPETLDLAFYLKRKRLVVEQLHLPPELGENDDAQKGRTGTSLTMSCSSSGSTSSSKLDF